MQFQMEGKQSPHGSPEESPAGFEGIDAQVGPRIRCVVLRTLGCSKPGEPKASGWNLWEGRAAHVQSVDPDEELAKEGNQTVGHSSQYDYEYDDEDNEEPVTFLE